MIQLTPLKEASKMYILENQDFILNNDEEKIEIAKLLKKDTLILNRELDDTYLIQEYPKYRTYEIEKIYFLDPLTKKENNQTEENQTEIINKNKNFNIYHIWIILIITIIWIIIIQNPNLSNSNLKNNVLASNQEKDLKTEFDLLTKKINSNNLLIQKKLELQKDFRLKKQEYEKFIEQSINEVQKIEQENLYFRNDLINLSQ